MTENKTSTATTPNIIVNGVDVTALGATVAAVQEQPEIAKFQFRAKNKWLGGGTIVPRSKDSTALVRKTTPGQSPSSSRMMNHLFSLDETRVPILSNTFSMLWPDA